jgi:hypothetical protein
MPTGESPEEHLPEYDFDPEKLNLRVRVTLAADRKAVDQVVEQVMAAVREMKCVNGKEDAIDPGPGFDPSAIPSCTVGENLYSNHGRGIFLINQLMDEVKFRKNGTEIHMVKR